MSARSIVRSVKNATKGYSEAQIKVRNATCNSDWGPLREEMAEIAQLTFVDTATFYEVIDIIDKRLRDKGRHWRHVLKSLNLLEYCLHEGSELVCVWARKNIDIIKHLEAFQRKNGEGQDVGIHIRVLAKLLTALILDEERLQKERADGQKFRKRPVNHPVTLPRPAQATQPISSTHLPPYSPPDTASALSNKLPALRGGGLVPGASMEAAGNQTNKQLDESTRGIMITSPSSTQSHSKSDVTALTSNGDFIPEAVLLQEQESQPITIQELDPDTSIKPVGNLFGRERK